MTQNFTFIILSSKNKFSSTVTLLTSKISGLDSTSLYIQSTYHQVNYSLMCFVSGTHMVFLLSCVYCEVTVYHVSKTLYQGLLLTHRFFIVNI